MTRSKPVPSGKRSLPQRRLRSLPARLVWLVLLLGKAAWADAFGAAGQSSDQV